MLSTAEIIDIVFIPIYAILFFVALFSFFKHSRGKKAAFGLLFVFPLVRLIGNILIVASIEYSKKSSVDYDTLKSLTTSGFILQLAGFGLLFSSALGLTNRAILYQEKDKKKGRQPHPQQQQDVKSSILSSPSRLLHLLNMLATILIIIGLAKSTDAFNPASTDHSISTVAKVGTIILLIATVILTVLVVYHLFVVGPVAPSARVILSFVLVACIPMLARAAFSTYKLTGIDDLTKVNIWAQLVLQYICESVAVIILLALAFTLHARGGDGDLDERYDVNTRAAAAVNAQSPWQQGHYSSGTPYDDEHKHTSYSKA